MHGSRRDDHLAALAAVAAARPPGTRRPRPGARRARPAPAWSSPAPTPTSPPCCVRLLRTDRLDVEVAYLPADAGRRPPRRGGCPPAAAAAALALTGTARPSRWSATTAAACWSGRGEIRDVARRVLLRRDAGAARVARRRLVVAARARRDRGARRAGAAGRPTGGSAPVPATRSARAAARRSGRAVQVGCAPATVVADGVPHPRPVPRWTWYRHTADWLLVAPLNWPQCPDLADRRHRRSNTSETAERRRRYVDRRQPFGQSARYATRPRAQHPLLAFTRTGHRSPAAPPRRGAPGDPRTAPVGEPRGTCDDHRACDERPSPPPSCPWACCCSRPAESRVDAAGTGGSAPAAASCVDTSGCVDQDRLPELALRHDGDQREHRLRLAEAWPPTQINAAGGVLGKQLHGRRRGRRVRADGLRREGRRS